MFKTMNVNWIVNYCQFLEIFLIQKYASLQKYIKIEEHIFVFALKNAAHCIRGQNKNIILSNHPRASWARG